MLSVATAGPGAAASSFFTVPRQRLAAALAAPGIAPVSSIGDPGPGGFAAPTLLGQVGERTGGVSTAPLLVAGICLVALAGCTVLRCRRGWPARPLRPRHMPHPSGLAHRVHRAGQRTDARSGLPPRRRETPRPPVADPRPRGVMTGHEIRVAALGPVTDPAVTALLRRRSSGLVADEAQDRSAPALRP